MLGFIIGLVIGLIIGVILGALLRLRRRPTPITGKPRLYISRFEFEDGTFVEGDLKMANIRAGKSTVATVKYEDGFGNPAPIQPGSTVATSSDETIATVELLPEVPDADGKVFESKVRCRSLGPVGATQINVNADGDLGAAEAPVPASGALGVTPGDAKVAKIEFGPEED